MASYVEKNLNMKETVLKKAGLHPVFLVCSWIWGVLGCWLLFIPTIKAIKNTVNFCTTELAFTEKRLIGKVGFINTKALDAPLNKLESVSVSSGLWGKVFRYGTLMIVSGDSRFVFVGVKDAEDFKKALMKQIDEYENQKLKQQAIEMAASMSVINQQS